VGDGLANHGLLSLFILGWRKEGVKPETYPLVIPTRKRSDQEESASCRQLKISALFLPHTRTSFSLRNLCDLCGKPFLSHSKKLNRAS
jgi:hypothetical protein